MSVVSSPWKNSKTGVVLAPSGHKCSPAQEPHSTTLHKESHGCIGSERLRVRGHGFVGWIMSSRIFFAPENLDWKKAYMAAVLEKDRVRLPDLIQDALEKLAHRLRELSGMGLVPSDEIEAIHDAFYLLQALRSSLPYRNQTGEWTRSSPDD